MTRAEVISVIALLVSIATVGFSVFFNLRDRARLKTMSTFHWDDPAGRPDSISVAVINAGRRPIILRMWGGTAKNGQSVGIRIGEDNSGLRLAEHERFDLSLERTDLDAWIPENDPLVEFQDLWVEDSLGRRYPIKDARANIQKLRDASPKSS